MKVPDKIWRTESHFDDRDFLEYSEEPDGNLSNTEYTRTALLSDEKYLASVGLIPKPVLCDKCGDTGIGESEMVAGEMRNKICPCTENPAAWVNVKKTLGG